MEAQVDALRSYIIILHMDDLAPYLDRIRAWDPALAIRAARADPYGLSNFVIIVNEEWVFRFPRSEASRERLVSEARLLSMVRKYVSLSVPAFEVDEAQDFVVYRLLPGRPLYHHELLRLDDNTQDRFAADLAAFLRDLHAIPADALAEAGLPPAPPPPDSLTLWEDRLQEIRTELYSHLWADQHAYVEDLFAPVLDDRLDMTTYTPTLIHNDLASYHLLGDPTTGRLTGVLDFGSAGWGDPAHEFAVLISVYGESLLGRLERHNPAIGDLLDRARFRAAYIELKWALRGVRTGDPGWYLVHLGRARDIRPIER